MFKKICIAFTKKGKKCENKALKKSDYCGKHKSYNNLNFSLIEPKGDLVKYPYTEFKINNKKEIDLIINQISLDNFCYSNRKINQENVVMYKREGNDHYDNGYCSGPEGEEIVPFYFIKIHKELKFNFDYPNENNNKPEEELISFYFDCSSVNGSKYCNTNGYTETIIAIDPCLSPRNKKYFYKIKEQLILDSKEESFYENIKIVSSEIKLTDYQCKNEEIMKYFSKSNLKYIKNGFSYISDEKEYENQKLEFVKFIELYNISKPFIKELLLSRKEIENNKLFDIKAFLIIGNYLQ